MEKRSRIMQRDKCVLFEPVSVATDENSKPISIGDQLFVTKGGIRDGEKLLKNVLETGKVKKENIMIRQYYLISGKDLKRICDKEEIADEQK